MGVLPYGNLRQGLVGAWCPAILNGGLTVVDLGPYRKNGTIVNPAGLAYVGTPVGVSASLTVGSSPYVSFTTAPPYPTGNAARTYSCWIYMTSYATYGMMIDSGAITSRQRFMFLVMGGPTYSSIPAGRLTAEFNGSTSYSSGSVPLNTWTHCCTTYDNSVMRMWINGVEQTVTNLFGPFPLNTAAGSFYLWCDQREALYSTAQYNDTRIYNRALTPQEVQALATRPGAGLGNYRRVFTPQPCKYPVTTDPHRVFGNTDGVWVPGRVNARGASAWSPAQLSVNQSNSFTVTPTISDPDALAYVAKVEDADGQALETATKQAIERFIIGLKADGIWSKMKGACILSGARTLAGALIPLVGSAPTNVSFVTADYNRKTGLQGDGSSKYLNTNIAHSSIALNDEHMAAFVTSATTGMLMASTINGTGSTAIYWGVNLYCQNNTGTGMPSGSTAVPKLYGVARASSANYTYLLSGTKGVVTSASNGRATTNVLIFAGYNGGVPAIFTTARIPFYSLGAATDLPALELRVTQLYNDFAAAIP